MNNQDIVRFWKKVNKNGPIPEYRPELGPCWLWLGHTLRGYGLFNVSTGRRRAHRVLYEHINGPVPDGLGLDHLCRVRACVNPAHLEPVTNQENQHRGFGVVGINARKTHCIRGHEFTGNNLIIRPNGWRACRTCDLRKQKNRRDYNRVHRLCIHCSKLVSAGHTACDECLATQLIRARLRRTKKGTSKAE
jgi:hypothetical protein